MIHLCLEKTFSEGNTYRGVRRVLWGPNIPIPEKKRRPRPLGFDQMLQFSGERM